jgi:hypothetical protein
MFIIILDCYAPSFCFLKIKQTEHIYDNRYNGYIILRIRLPFFPETPRDAVQVFVQQFRPP